MKIVFIFATLGILYAVPIDVFKSKKPLRFDGYGVTMTAKITALDCNSQLGYSKSSSRVCKATANYRIAGSDKEKRVTLYYDRDYEDRLRDYMINGTYGFISCTYSDYLKKLFDCSFK